MGGWGGVGWGSWGRSLRGEVGGENLMDGEGKKGKDWDGGWWCGWWVRWGHAPRARPTARGTCYMLLNTLPAPPCLRRLGHAWRCWRPAPCVIPPLPPPPHPTRTQDRHPHRRRVLRHLTFMHACKHPSRAVNGLLLGSASGGDVNASKAMPLFHGPEVTHWHVSVCQERRGRGGRRQRQVSEVTHWQANASSTRGPAQLAHRPHPFARR